MYKKIMTSKNFEILVADYLFDWTSRIHNLNSNNTK